ncbi:MAG: helix-turn-helix domain-containing protein [Syntrophobacteraceae bacterium]
MTFGERMKRLRQERGWSQGQLAQQLKVHQKQISGYERGVHLPSTDLLIRIAALYNVSLDYLAFDNREDVRQVRIADRDLLQKLEELDKFSEQDKSTIKAVLDTFILKNRFQKLASATEG